MDIPSREDYGLVWMGQMGDVMLPTESNDSMLGHHVEESYLDTNSQMLSEEDIRFRVPMNMEAFMTLDDMEDSTRWYQNEIQDEVMMVEDASIPICPPKVALHNTTETNSPYVPRKIKPVRHPALKLKTPIAYQCNTDLDVIPIQKDGRAVCKTCGAIGVKHAFYTRNRCYCSLACARGSGESNIQEPAEEVSEEMPKIISTQMNSWTDDSTTFDSPDIHKQDVELVEESKLGLKCVSNAYLIEQENLLESQLPPAYTLPLEPTKSTYVSHDWADELTNPCFSAAPVMYFPHAPMSDLWDSIDPGLKVEVENTDGHEFSNEFPLTYWIASIVKIEGYKALLRYEGFGYDDSKDFWINLCSSAVHPVGYCAVRGKPLIPPKSIKNKYPNWKEFLKDRLTGARTLPLNFHNRVQDSLKSRFRCELTVEVVNKTKVSEVTIARIEKVVGKRLQLRYQQMDHRDPVDFFWCHEDSPLIHPVGWARRIGQRLKATLEYHDRMLKGLREKDDATADLFLTPERFPASRIDYFQEGMKLEAIDPLNLNDICVATVMQVLNEGYLMIRVDFWKDQNMTADDWFCYHRTSPCIFPAGFCSANGISLTPPKDYNRSNFEWTRYLEETGCVPAPAHLFNNEQFSHGFCVGMKLEAADLMNPLLVCVATIKQVVGRLLKIHFDGWESEYDQWIDCNSCDIYPVGWCELVGHRLEPPCSETTLETKPIRSKKKPRARISGYVKTESIQEDDGKENSMTEERSNITYIDEEPKLIPRLSEYKSRTSGMIIPESWDVNDVAEFLKINDCSHYCDAFIQRNIDGKKLLRLTKDDVLRLAEMKVGPSLKIQNLLSQLLSKSQGTTRLSKSSKPYL